MTMEPIVIRSAAAASEAAQRALEITITNDQQWQEAQLYLVKVDAVQKRLEADEEELKRPFLDELARIREAARPLKALVAFRRAELAAKILDYEEARDREARKAQAKALAQWEKAAERAEQKAIEKGLPVPQPGSPPVYDTVAKTQEVAGAQVTTRITKSWRIRPVVFEGALIEVEPKGLSYEEAQHLGLKIPAKYFVLNTESIGRIIRSGGEVPDILPVDQKGKVIKQVGTTDVFQ